ncbi:MAG: hypothetical protein KA152_01315 [Verrucomicrobiales bacterium]|nr:hypothetical protein [Verrucomicrobiales bacterium]
MFTRSLPLPDVAFRQVEAVAPASALIGAGFRPRRHNAGKRGERKRSGNTL